MRKSRLMFLFLVMFLVGSILFIEVKALDEPSGWSYGWYLQPNYISEVFGNVTLSGFDNRMVYETTVTVKALSPYIATVQMQNYTGGGIFMEATGTVFILQSSTDFNSTAQTGSVTMLNGTFSFAVPNVMGGTDLYMVIDIVFEHSYNETDFIYAYHWIFSGATPVTPPSTGTLIAMSTFLMDIFLIGVPAFLFFPILGFAGVLFGLVIGSGLAVQAGILPVWICILIAFVMFLIVFLGRSIKI